MMTAVYVCSCPFAIFQVLVHCLFNITRSDLDNGDTAVHNRKLRERLRNTSAGLHLLPEHYCLAPTEKELVPPRVTFTQLC